MSDPGQPPPAQPATVLYLTKKDMEDIIYFLGFVLLGVGGAISFLHNLLSFLFSSSPTPPVTFVLPPETKSAARPAAGNSEDVEAHAGGSMDVAK